MQARKKHIAKDAGYGVALGAGGALAGYFASGYSFCRSYMPAQVDNIINSPRLQSEVIEPAYKYATGMKEFIWPHFDSKFAILAPNGEFVRMAKSALSDTATNAAKTAADILKSSISETCMSTMNAPAMIAKIGVAGAATGLVLALAYHWLGSSSEIHEAVQDNSQDEQPAATTVPESVKVSENESAASPLPVVSTGETLFAPRRGNSELQQIIQANPFNFDARAPKSPGTPA